MTLHGHGLLTTALLLSAVLLWEVVCTSLQSDCSLTVDNEETRSDDHSLLQLSLVTDEAGTGDSDNLRDESCEMLGNKFTYFSVNVCVGKTQCFDILLDTGSNNVLVPACSGQGPGDPRACFTRQKSGSWEDSGQSRMQTFGMGSVDADIGTDLVTMAGKTAEMVDGVFLMTYYHSDRMSELTGIMGMGVGDGKGNDKVFIKRAGVERFSICFRDMGKDGALRLDVPELVSPLPSIGSNYWMLSLSGISIGAHNALMEPLDVTLCDPSEAPACAMIVDSGTTQILGPENEVWKLRSALCRRWKRCSEKAEGTLGSEESVFREMVFRCQEWLTEDKGLLEIPSLFLRVGDDDVVELTAWAFITEFGGRPGFHYCADAFGNAVMGGGQPVWVFGLPLFYEYQVNFDFTNKQIEFKKGKCLACGEGMSLSEERVDHRRPRWMLEPGAPRIPQYNLSLPL